MGNMADIDEMMYSCGLEILHPGGIEKTDEMVRMCKIGKDKKVLEAGGLSIHLSYNFEERKRINFGCRICYKLQIASCKSSVIM